MHAPAWFRDDAVFLKRSGREQQGALSTGARHAAVSRFPRNIRRAHNPTSSGAASSFRFNVPNTFLISSTLASGVLANFEAPTARETGKASCRERVCQDV